MSQTVEIARHYSREIRNARDIWSAFRSVIREAKELRTEITNGSTGVDAFVVIARREFERVRCQSYPRTTASKPWPWSDEFLD